MTVNPSICRLYPFSAPQGSARRRRSHSGQWAELRGWRGMCCGEGWDRVRGRGWGKGWGRGGEGCGDAAALSAACRPAFAPFPLPGPLPSPQCYRPWKVNSHFFITFKTSRTVANPFESFLIPLPSLHEKRDGDLGFFQVLDLQNDMSLKK